MGIHAISERHGYPPPAGPFAAWLDGTCYHTTQAVAREIFLARHDVPPAGWPAAANEYFLGGYRGNTGDAFWVAVLLAFGMTPPDYPAALHAAHEERNRRFWAGVGGFATAIVEGSVATQHQEEILEAGRREADKSEGR